MLIGALVIGFLSDGLVLVGVSSFWQLVIKGAVIVLAVMIDQAQERMKRAQAAAMAVRAAGVAPAPHVTGVRDLHNHQPPQGGPPPC